MKSLLAVALIAFIAGPAFADTCTGQADAKKLAGATRTSFLGKCQRDATSSCDTRAASKKLYGAAKTSFTNKCVRDAVGSPS